MQREARELAAVSLVRVPWALGLFSPGLLFKALQSSLEATRSSKDVTGSPERS